MKKMILFLIAFMIQSMVINSQTTEEIFPVLRGPYLGQDPPGNQNRVFAPDFVSTDAGELNSAFTLDGREFYFSRRGVPGKPSAIMVSRMIDDVWISPVPVDLSGVYSDIDLFISPDGKYFFYTSNKNGSEDIYWVSAGVMEELPDTVTAAQKGNTNEEIFINYFMKNWEDIHDVIMRYHNDNPGLKGLVEINMVWDQGKLDYAVVLSNSTGDSAFGLSLVETMKKWTIPGLADGWSSTLPIRTAIVGSDNPEFNECGIFTGKITDIDGNPINGARLVIHKVESLDSNPDTVYTNREGVFIRTLIRPGTWQVECTKQGFRPVEINQLIIEEGQHCKRAITMIALCIFR